LVRGSTSKLAFLRSVQNKASIPDLCIRIFVAAVRISWCEISPRAAFAQHTLQSGLVICQL
jgi:hypothetical protein